MNFVLALSWLALALAVFARQVIFGDPGWYLPVGAYRISWGWPMLVLVVYNLTRWWSVRAARIERRRRQLALSLQPVDAYRGDKPMPAEPPNPDLNFTEKAPAAPQSETNVTEGPRGTT
jgi:hypothetical protein